MRPFSELVDLFLKNAGSETGFRAITPSETRRDWKARQSPLPASTPTPPVMGTNTASNDGIRNIPPPM